MENRSLLRALYGKLREGFLTALLLVLMVTVVTRVAGQRSACDEARLGGMQAQFGECTQRYKAEYRTAIEVTRNMSCRSNIKLQHIYAG